MNVHYYIVCSYCRIRLIFYIIFDIIIILLKFTSERRMARFIELWGNSGQNHIIQIFFPQCVEIQQQLRMKINPKSK